MSLEDQYDAWVRGLMGGKIRRYVKTGRGGQRRRAADAGKPGRADRCLKKRQSAAGSALDAVQKAGAATAESVRKMSSELTRSLHQDVGCWAGPPPRRLPNSKNADNAREHGFGGADKIKAQVLGQDAFVGAGQGVPPPLCDGHGGDTGRARNLMLLCGPNGTGRHALTCAVEELAGRGILRNAAIERMDLSLYPANPGKYFTGSVCGALQSDAEFWPLTYEGCAASVKYCRHWHRGDAFAERRAVLCCSGASWWTWAPRWPGAIGELTAGGKYFVFSPTRTRPRWPIPLEARFVDALAGRLPHPGLYPRGAGRRGRPRAELACAA